MRLLNKIWEFISRLARVIVEIDDMWIEAKAFWEWLGGGDEDEPEKKRRKKRFF